MDTRRVVRQQLTDVILRISDMNIKLAVSPQEGEYLAPAISSAARLAGTLVMQLPQSLVNDVDYVTLASVAYDPLEVKQYYEKAIAICNSSYYRVLARRGYGSRLFETGDYPAGRSQFRAVWKTFRILPMNAMPGARICIGSGLLASRMRKILSRLPN
jgi:hypothetical protein